MDVQDEDYKQDIMLEYKLSDDPGDREINDIASGEPSDWAYDIAGEEEVPTCECFSNCIDDSMISPACQYMGDRCQCGSMECDYHCHCGDGHLPFADDLDGSWAFYKIHIPEHFSGRTLTVTADDCWQSLNLAAMMVRNRIPTVEEFERYLSSGDNITDPASGIWVNSIGPVGDVEFVVTNVIPCEAYYIILHNEWTEHEAVFTYECNHGGVSGCYANAGCGWFMLYYTLH